MKTMQLGKVFTNDQLKQAAAMMHNCPHPHEDLKNMLKPDKARLDQLGIDIGYAAYLLEYHRSGIVSEFGTEE